MQKITAVATAGLAAISLSVALVGCGSKTETKTTTSTSTSTSTTTSTSAAASASPTESKGPNETIQDYLKANNIQETAIHRGDAGSPTIDLPFPPDWSDAGPQTPDWAYGAIVYDKPETPDDPPSIIAIVSKLTGNVDPAKILELAPGELKNLPNYEPLGDDNKSTLSGFDAVQLGGNYTKEGKKRIIAQKTVVIPTNDGLYVLQLNADALDGQEGVLMDATSVIDEKTTITP